MCVCVCVCVCVRVCVCMLVQARYLCSQHGRYAFWDQVRGRKFISDVACPVGIGQGVVSLGRVDVGRADACDHHLYIYNIYIYIYIYI
jgi:hypothetical protein